ncbi:hypothetical protein LINPERHAP1_LOCUS27243 [Linum perenne]
MAEVTKLFISCSVLMAALFAYSASVQLNDPGASAVNLVGFTGLMSVNKIRMVARLTFWGGQLLLWKVVVEDLVKGNVGLWCLDLSERVVREKVGSLIVVLSMVLHLKVDEGMKKGRNWIAEAVDYGKFD